MHSYRKNFFKTRKSKLLLLLLIIAAIFLFFIYLQKYQASSDSFDDYSRYFPQTQNDHKFIMDESKLNITEEIDLKGRWSCEKGLPLQDGYIRRAGCTCINDYNGFIQVASVEGHSKPITNKYLEKQLTFLRNGSVPVLQRGDLQIQEDLKNIILKILNVGFLYERVNSRPLNVKTIKILRRPGYIEKELLITDPYVGTFKALYLLPDKKGPFPGIVALHGHSDCAESFRDNYNGKEFAQNGYAIMIPTLRAMCCGQSENIISRQLLLNGFTLYGLRHYESMLCKKYLESRKEIDRDSIGLIGHSSGSCVANLYLGEHFKAFVTDDSCSFFDFSEAYNEEDEKVMLLKDSTIPYLYPYSVLVKNYAEEKPNVLITEYGLEDFEKIIVFFNRWLRK